MIYKDPKTTFQGIWNIVMLCLMLMFVAIIIYVMFGPVTHSCTLCATWEIIESALTTVVVWVLGGMMWVVILWPIIGLILGFIGFCYLGYLIVKALNKYINS